MSKNSSNLNINYLNHKVEKNSSSKDSNEKSSSKDSIEKSSPSKDSIEKSSSSSKDCPKEFWVVTKIAPDNMVINPTDNKKIDFRPKVNESYKTYIKIIIYIYIYIYM